MNTTHRAAGLLVAICLAGCGADPSGQPTSPAPENAATSVPETPAPPAHLWQVKDGQEYGYAAALSQDEQNAGKAVSDVVMFRYLGREADLYKVAVVKGPQYAVLSCANPCAVVKEVIGGLYASDVQRMTFNPASLIGEALTDAMNGQMEVYGSAAPEPVKPPAQAPIAAPVAAEGLDPSKAAAVQGGRDVQRLLAEEEKQNDLCRGNPGDDPDTITACKRRDALDVRIEAEGWCYGEGAKSGADSHWALCVNRRVPAASLALQ